ncbi:MAG: shikimate kinase [Flavobacteriaceae bacterium]
MKIILMGYMGSGKSTIGKLLANEMGLRFFDLDAYISEQEGLPIPDIFDQKGEIYFRKRESEHLVGVLDQEEALVLAVGGGTPCYGTNLQTILEASPNVFYLKYPIVELASRLSMEREQRPLIKDLEAASLQEFIAKHLFERRAYYEQAHHIVDGQGLDKMALVQELAKLLV